MVFNTLTFVAFFALVLAVNALPLAWKTRKINLLVASYIFYAAWNPPFILLLWISTVVDWYAAQGLVRAQGQASGRAWMLRARTGAPGVHFEDHPTLGQGYEFPEWSHMSRSSAERYTAELYRVLEREHALPAGRRW